MYYCMRTRSVNLIDSFLPKPKLCVHSNNINESVYIQARRLKQGANNTDKTLTDHNMVDINTYMYFQNQLAYYKT